jgi:hypothetical protein
MNLLQRLRDAVGRTNPNGVLTSAQLEATIAAENQAIADWTGEKAALQAELPVKRFAGDPGAAKDEKRLIELRNKIESAREYVAVLEAARAEALAAEDAGELAAARAEAERVGKNFIAASEDLKAQIVALVEAAAATVAAGNDFIAAMRAIPEPRNAYEPLFFQSLLPMWLNYEIRILSDDALAVSRDVDLPTLNERFRGIVPLVRDHVGFAANEIERSQT